MFRIDDTSAAAVMPVPEAAATEGYWTEGNPATGVPATLERASWFNMVQEELRAIVVQGGLIPSKTVYTQTLTAIQAFIQGQSMTYAADTGAANAAVVSYSPAVTALTDGMVLWFKAKAANTGATTLNVNGLGVQPVVGGAHSALQGGEIIANGKCQVIWNATLSSWVLIECTGGALQAAAGVQSGQAVNLGQFASSLGTTSNYKKFPGGLLLQWGYVTSPAQNSSMLVTFPIAFSALPTFAGATEDNTFSNGTTDSAIQTSRTSVSQLTIGKGTNGGSIAHENIVFWLALGLA